MEIQILRIVWSVECQMLLSIAITTVMTWKVQISSKKTRLGAVDGESDQQ